MIPRNRPEPLVAMEFRELVSQLMRAASGLPSSMYMMEPVTRVVSSGMMTTGMRLRSQRGALRPASQAARKPERIPPIRPPMKPEFVATATMPMMKPGAMPGRPARPKEM